MKRGAGERGGETERGRSAHTQRGRKGGREDERGRQKDCVNH